MRSRVTSGRLSAASSRLRLTRSGIRRSTWNWSTHRLISSGRTRSATPASGTPIPAGRWDVFAYCKNCFNTLYRIYNLDLSGFLGINQSVYGPPRLYGASVAYHWGK